MTKKFKLLCLLVCLLFAVTQLTGCIEITKRQPESIEDPTSPEQTISVKPSPAERSDVASVSWVEYTEDPGGLIFSYPQGWEVATSESAISIENAETYEQLLMSTMPFDENKDPYTLATEFISLVETNNPNLHASNWRTNPQTANSQVAFDLYDKIDGIEYDGSGIVIKDSVQAIWFSYFAPSSAYSSDRATELLHGFIRSLGTESSSGTQEPNNTNTSKRNSRIEANAKGFLFILEFGLGAPFTAEQEQIILDEVITSWSSLTEAELSAYDEYPLLAEFVLTLGQEELNELRETMENIAREWLDESPDSDKVVRIIRDQLNTRGKVVIAGDPPLTEMSLTAYSEIIAYSRLLRENPQALPEQVSSNSINDIKKQVLDSWETFTREEQEQIATSPGLWFCLRTLVNKGSESEQNTIRNELRKLTPETQTATGGGTTSSGTSGGSMSGKPMDSSSHAAMLGIQQMTFNSYMWSRGFNYSIAHGKMW